MTATMLGAAAGVAIAALLSLAGSARGEGERRESAVGLPARIDALVIEGTELEAAPGEKDSPIVLRVLEAYPHGSAFRYDIEYYGLEPGEHDLAKSLRRMDGSAASDIPRIEVTIVSSLPPGAIRPHPSRGAEVGVSGGYRALLFACGVVWAAGLAALVLALRRKRATSFASAEARPATLAERLRPLVLRAARGELPPKERAELELRLIAYWRRRLALEEMAPDEALARLKRHEDAGPLLLGLEDWLHRPSSPKEVDVARLLEPYRNVTDDAFSPLAASESRGV